ncbi:MAG TPA: acetyltransferase [Thermoleophilaceae bacterium]|nr:acetyltransferase [Thermoleophilaceae bacterium]
MLICGTRSFAEEVADLVSEIPELELRGFVENMDRARCERELEGRPVHWVGDIGELAPSHSVVCALVTTERGRFTDQVEGMGFRAAAVVHPSARVAPSASVSEGAIVSAGVVTGAHARIGRHALLNRGVLVGHHTAIGAHASILPGANVAGNCRVGERAFVGMGALVLDNIEVGADSVVAAGSVVTRDVPARCKVMGVPARMVDVSPSTR